MNQAIIYPTEDDGIAVVIPSSEWDGTIEELVKKDVPQGVPYLIIQESDIPSDRTFRGAWQANFKGASTNDHDQH